MRLWHMNFEPTLPNRPTALLPFYLHHQLLSHTAWCEYRPAELQLADDVREDRQAGGTDAVAATVPQSAIVMRNRPDEAAPDADGRRVDGARHRDRDQTLLPDHRGRLCQGHRASLFARAEERAGGGGAKSGAATDRNASQGVASQNRKGRFTRHFDGLRRLAK